MRALIDSIFGPVFSWLDAIYNAIFRLSVPATHGFNPFRYLGFLNLFPGNWKIFVSTTFMLLFVFGITSLIFTYWSLYQRFKNAIKWW